MIAVSASAQAPTRRATNISALAAFPVFYHGRSVLIVGTVETQNDGQVRVSDGTASLRVVFKGSAPDGNDEIRGEFWDLGRMKSDDPRLVSIDLRRTFGVDPEGAWPRAGEATALMATAPSSQACSEAKSPSRPPMGVRTAETMTMGSDMVSSNEVDGLGKRMR